MPSGIIAETCLNRSNCKKFNLAWIRHTVIQNRAKTKPLLRQQERSQWGSIQSVIYHIAKQIISFFILKYKLKAPQTHAITGFQVLSLE